MHNVRIALRYYHHELSCSSFERILSKESLFEASAFGWNMESATSSSNAATPTVTMPRDVTNGTAQPTELVIRFMWIICAVGGDKKYQCKLCGLRFSGLRFTGQKATVITHFMNDFSEQRVSRCMENVPEQLHAEFKIALAKKTKDEYLKKKRNYSEISSKNDIGALLKNQARPLADSACLELVISLGLSATVVESPAFRKFTR